jgi:hypothetical protein
MIYSSQKPRKSSSLPLKSSSQLFSHDGSLTDVREFISLEINTYETQFKIRSHFSGKKSVSYWPGNTVPNSSDMMTLQVNRKHWVQVTGKTCMHFLNNDHLWNTFWHDVRRGIAQGRWGWHGWPGWCCKMGWKIKFLNENTQFSAPTKFWIIKPNSRKFCMNVTSFKVHNSC